MRLSSVFIRDELNDEQNDALKCLAQSRPDALHVCSIKTANDSLIHSDEGLKLETSVYGGFIYLIHHVIKDCSTAFK